MDTMEVESLCYHDTRVTRVTRKEDCKLDINVYCKLTHRLYLRSHHAIHLNRGMVTTVHCTVERKPEGREEPLCKSLH